MNPETNASLAPEPASQQAATPQQGDLASNTLATDLPLQRGVVVHPVPPEALEAGVPTITVLNSNLPPQGAERPTALGRRQQLRSVLWVSGLVVVVALAGVAWYNRGHASSDRPHPSRTTEQGAEGEGEVEAGMAVRIVHPEKKTLVRTITLPGSIQPWAQAELYAKVSGYLQFIQRERTPTRVGHLVARAAATALHGGGLSLNNGFALAASSELSHWLSPQKDIGSRVEPDELLMEIAVPELHQDIIRKQTLVLQREAELAEARTQLATLDAQLKATEAQKEEAEADIQRAAAEHTFRTKQLERLEKLVLDRTVTADNLDERQHQAQATLAAWKSSKAKAQTAQANILAVSSKLATARAEVQVKELLVQVARDEVRAAQILADYANIAAPFAGVITYRGVDEGDFVQNATSGQARNLMTITAVDRVKVVVQVPEQDAPWVEPGAEATVQLEGRLRYARTGRVTRLGDILDPQSRTMQVEIDLDNRDHRLKPGMYGQVTLTLQKIPDAQALPASAVYSRKGKSYLIEVHEGIAHYHQVRLRYDDGLVVEAVKLDRGKEVPLNGTEDVVASNKGEIRDGQRIASAH